MSTREGPFQHLVLGVEDLQGVSQICANSLGGCPGMRYVWRGTAVLGKTADLYKSYVNPSWTQTIKKNSCRKLTHQTI